MESFDGFGGGFGGFEINVPETEQVLVFKMVGHWVAVLDIPFAQATAITHQSAVSDCAEACQLFHEIVLGHIKE